MSKNFDSSIERGFCGAKVEEQDGEQEPTVEEIRAASGDHMEVSEEERGNFHVHGGKLYILESIAAQAVMRGEERLIAAETRTAKSVDSLSEPTELLELLREVPLNLFHQGMDREYPNDPHPEWCGGCKLKKRIEDVLAKVGSPSEEGTGAEWMIQFEHRSGNKIGVRKDSEAEARELFRDAQIGKNEVAIRLLRLDSTVMATRLPAPPVAPPEKEVK